MERSLNPDLVELALGRHERLPSPEEFADALAEAEIGLLAAGGEVQDAILSAAWYLHGIASSAVAQERYGLARQRAAFQVAAHAFDVALQHREQDYLERARLTFASQVAYLHSEFNPNALALYRREFPQSLPELELLENPSGVGLSAGVSLLAFDVEGVLGLGRRIVTDMRRAAELFEVERIRETTFGAAAGVTIGCRDLCLFLIYGDEALLESARSYLDIALRAEASAADQDSRWTAAHLLRLLDGMANSSLWGALPPNVPPEVRRGFAMAPPRILTLWPPQLDLVKGRVGGERNPLSSAARRLFISTPTSGGKTLFAQILIASQLANEGGAVCYVAPTRSLCQEVRRTIEGRLRFITGEVVDWLPDWAITEDFLEEEPRVEVMTPERLLFLLRNDTAAVLSRFGMFVVDEVHTVGDGRRGWVVEQMLTHLHHLTSSTDHRLVLMSAAVGNKQHFVQWMTAAERNPIPFESDWRAPRRVYCLYTTEPDWDSGTIEERRSAALPFRARYPTRGVLWARGPRGRHHKFETSVPVGELVLNRKRPHQRGGAKDSSMSTAAYRQLVPIIHHLSALGPVLVIEATRSGALRMAKAIAEDVKPQEGVHLSGLISLVRTRLGNDHPLSSLLSRRVAYHHGSLPAEIRTGIEDGINQGLIDILVATTTMTEGVNLPVRSVVIAATGIHTAEGFNEYIRGPKLLNAVGRAGRATKETEGVVVLAVQKRPEDSDFDTLTPKAEELTASSWLSTRDALDDLAGFEELQRSAVDALLKVGTNVVGQFLSFVWFVASEMERLDYELSEVSLDDWLNDTLAWVQLGEVDRLRWRAAAETTLRRYRETESGSRRRWARSGTTLGTAARLERMAEELAREAEGLAQDLGDRELVDFLLGGSRLEDMLGLPEAPKTVAYSARARGRQELDLSMKELLSDWLEGEELLDLAHLHFSSVSDLDFRFEQLGDHINDYFEVFLPWVMSILIDWTNERLRVEGADREISHLLPGMVRWGVPSTVEASLMNRGLRSRQLARRVVTAWRRADSEYSVLEWLRHVPVRSWESEFGGTDDESRNLVGLLRTHRSAVLPSLLKGDLVTLLLDTAEQREDLEGTAVLRSSESFGAIEVLVNGRLAGHVRPIDHDSVEDFLKLELPHTVELKSTSSGPRLHLKMVRAQEVAPSDVML